MASRGAGDRKGGKQHKQKLKGGSIGTEIKGVHQIKMKDDRRKGFEMSKLTSMM